MADNQFKMGAHQLQHKSDSLSTNSEYYKDFERPENLGYRWVTCHTAGSRRTAEVIPADAVLAGIDIEQSKIYAGRAHHQGELLPAKIVAGQRFAHAGYKGEEMLKNDFEALCGPPVAWKPAKGAVIPPNAIPVGNTKSGEKLFMGRSFHVNSLQPGRIDPSRGTMFIPFDGKEVFKTEYEVMVYPTF